MASPASRMTIPSSANASVLPGSRARGSGPAVASHVWPNPVPLDCGVIRLFQEKQAKHSRASAGPKFPPGQLKKLLIYCRRKGKSYYPSIRFSNWLHIATTKLSMSEDLAWIYFETFDVVSEIDAKDRLELLQLTSQCSSKDQLSDLRKKLSVDTLQFILFLFLQNAPRSSLKAMVVTEEWPSPEAEPRQKSAEHYHLMFLKARLQDLLEILQDSEFLLSEEVVKALGFVFCAAKNSQACTLLELAMSAASHSGYSQVSRNFCLTQFEFWVRSTMGLNPYGPHNLFSRRRELQPASCFRSDGTGRLLINSGAPSKHRSAMLYSISKQTLASSDENLQHGNIYMKNCRRSNIYLLAPLRCVHVEKCSRCVLVLGAVSSTITIANCDSLTVITACRRIHVSSSTMCVLHLLTMTRPLLLPASVHITVAPYNTHYPTLGAHLGHCGLSPMTNYWNSPVDLTGNSDPTSPTWGLMPPDLFKPMEVPFDLPGTTREIPCPLPAPYLSAMAAKKDRLKRWYELVEHADLSRDQNKLLETSVREHFDEWLAAEGHKKELLDLSFRAFGNVHSQQVVNKDGWRGQVDNKTSSSIKRGSETSYSKAEQ